MDTLTALENELNECGYQADLMVAALKDAYEPQTREFNLLTSMKLRGGDILLLDFEFRFYPMGRIELAGLSAALAGDRLQQLLYPLAEKKEIWQDFKDLPTIEAVVNALNGPDKQQGAKIIEHQFIHHSNNNIMNLNNLEDLKKEMTALRFDPRLIEEMEKNLAKGLPEFQLRDDKAVEKGQVDYTLHFKKSSQSEFYFLNKYDVSLNKGKPLEKDQKYMVISPGDKDKPVFRSFSSPIEAIAYFKEQKGDSELAIGKDLAHKTKLASYEKGAVNYVSDEFRKTYYSAAVKQTIFVEKGNGFTADQASNLIQGRSVYRDDMLSLGGQPYKAWMRLELDKPKDRYDNFPTKQYHDPSYGFDLKKELDTYNIKELDDPAKKEALIKALENGDRPAFHTTKDGQDVKLFIEAVPRYGNLNMFAENGKPEKREQFDKLITKSLVMGNDKEKNKDMAENKEMSV